MKKNLDVNKERKIKRHKLQAEQEDRSSKKGEIDQMDTKLSALVRRC